MVFRVRRLLRLKPIDASPDKRHNHSWCGWHRRQRGCPKSPALKPALRPESIRVGRAGAFKAGLLVFEGEYAMEVVDSVTGYQGHTSQLRRYRFAPNCYGH